MQKSDQLTNLSPHSDGAIYFLLCCLLEEYVGAFLGESDSSTQSLKLPWTAFSVM